MKTLTLIVLVCLAILTPSQQVSGQESAVRGSGPVSATKSEREQDGLIGPIRRVRTETTKVVLKEGKPIEGSRVMRGITTYDVAGHRIDTVVQPDSSSAPSGKKQFRYDDKGNIIEMVLSSDDGSILSKEVYQYEFDDLGNWKRMTTSVAVFEDGKIGFEPMEVTYRTITYYYTQAVEKKKNDLGITTTKEATVSASMPAKVLSAPTKLDIPPSESKPAAAEEATKTPVKADFSHSTGNPATNSSSPSAAKGSPAVEIKTTKTSANVAAPEVLPASPERPAVKRVSEEALRWAAINLPQPEYPQFLELAGVVSKVEVQVSVDENGEVITARSTSGDGILQKAAEAAARAARFAPGKLSTRGERVFGVLTYEFAPKQRVVADAKSEPEETTGTSGNPAAAAVAPLTIVKSEPDESTMRASGSLGTIPVVSPTTRSEPIDSSRTSSNPAAPAATTSAPPVTKAVPDESTTRTSSNPVAAPVAAPAASLRDATYFYQQGLSFLTSGQNTEAIGAFKQAVYRDPHHALAYVKLGLAYFALEQHKEAVGVFKMALDTKREAVDAEANYRLGESYSALGKHSEALAAFKQALYIKRAETVDVGAMPTEKFPTNADLHFGLGFAYYNRESYGDAVKELTEAVKLKPDFADAHFGLALAYIGRNDRAAAQKEERILRPLNSALADNVAMALANMLPSGVTRVQPREDRRMRP